jgi:hypothetical protein
MKDGLLPIAGEKYGLATACSEVRHAASPFEEASSVERFEAFTV